MAVKMDRTYFVCDTFEHVLVVDGDFRDYVSPIGIGINR